MQIEKSTLICSAVLSLALALCGCAAITLPTPQDIVSKPLGTESIKIGMTKERVISLWGKPDSIQYDEGKDSLHGRREVWYYGAHYSGIVPPVNAGYLSQSQRLYFDGNNLVEIK